MLVDHLEAGPAAVAAGVPPALVDRPRPGPRRDGHRRPAGQRRAGPAGADSSDRPDTATGSPRASTTPTAAGSTSTVAGAGAGTWPGHGSATLARLVAGRASVRSTAATGTRATRSAGLRPPRTSGTVTASAPSWPWSRATARQTRSSTRVSPPQNPSWRPRAATTSSGTSVSRLTPEVGRERDRAGEPAVELPAHPVGQRAGGEGALVAPAPAQHLAVLGLRPPPAPGCRPGRRRPGRRGGGRPGPWPRTRPGRPGPPAGPAPR